MKINLKQKWVTGTIEIETPGRWYRVIAAIEVALLEMALRQCHGNREHAAKLLGIKRTTMAEKLRRYKLEHEDLVRREIIRAIIKGAETVAANEGFTTESVLATLHAILKPSAAFEISEV